MQLDKQLQRILSRVIPAERLNLEHFLTNIALFIKRGRGDELTEQEITYPDHPRFAHFRHRKNKGAADILQRHIDIIDRYKIDDAKRIIDIIASLSLTRSEAVLTTRMIRLVLELYHDPLLPRYEIAARLGTTPRAITKDLSKLESLLGLLTLRFIDPHKFKLAHLEVAFRTKSLKDSDRLEQYFRRQRPKFLRWLAFDHDFRKGIMLYYVPDQPRGRRLFEERVKALNDEYFQGAYSIRKKGFYYTLSFDGYDCARGSWILEEDLVSEAIIRFAREHHKSLPKPKGHSFGEPIRFDRLDYLLAQTAFALPSKGGMDFRSSLLRKRGYDISKKNLWSREQKLRENRVYIPMVYYKIPAFEEYVMMGIQCPRKIQDIIKVIPSVLPYAVVSPTDRGINLTYQRPAYCGGISRQLTRTISNELDGGRIDIVRTSLTHGTTMIPDAVDRWDASRQRWLLEEGDI